MEPLKQEEFEREFEDLLNHKSSESRSIFGFLKRTLWQFNLIGIYEPSDILLIVYERAKSHREVINRPIPWIRATGFNVIRELNRQEKRQKDLAYKAICQSEQEIPNPLDDQISSETIDANLNQVRHAWNCLSQKEKDFLRLRLIEGLSWKSIQERLDSQGEKVKINSLSKRYSRTLSNLRKLFHSSLKDIM
jgi:DNA-directed RNA polymerase specialized sigma24 family protein